MKSLRPQLLVLIVAAAFASAPQPASALSYVMMSDEALLSQAEGVARVTVLEILPSSDDQNETRYRVRIDRAIAGQKLRGEHVLVLPGTFNAPTRNVLIDGVPHLREANTYLLFYSRRQDKTLRAQQLTLGIFGKVPDRSVYVRHLDGSMEIGKSVHSQRWHQPRDAAQFEGWIAARARGITTEPDYFLGAIESQIDYRQKFTFSAFDFKHPDFPVRPGRWYQFDTNQSLVWTAGIGGQTGATFDVYAALQTALTAWTNDPGSRISMSYSGTASGLPSCPNPFTAPGCFAGHVKWNDPDNEIEGSFDCANGGVLGIGGSSVYSDKRTFDEAIWYPRISAFVVVQDNAACAMNGSGGANGAELLTHEVGHAIGFGHSCGDSSSPSCGSNATLNAAIMRASLHGGGRGASLGVDDIAGAAVIYPDPHASCTGDCVFRSGFEPGH